MRKYAGKKSFFFFFGSQECVYGCVCTFQQTGYSFLFMAPAIISVYTESEVGFGNTYFTLENLWHYSKLLK